MEEFFKRKYGEDCIDVLRTPPLESSIRVNTLKIDVESAVVRIRELYDGFCVFVHERIRDLVIVRAAGPFEPKRYEVEVYVDFKCGEAVLRGSHVYCPGVLGSSRSFEKASQVSVFAIKHERPRGFKARIEDSTQKIYLGNGISQDCRKTIISTQKGLAVFMNDTKWKMPSFETLPTDLFYPQNLGSATVAHILKVTFIQPEIHNTVLDMCAAPGGKTSHLSCLMHNKGKIIACDKSNSRLNALKSHLNNWGISNVQVKKLDGTKAEATFGANSFDKVLLDAPCTGLGQRPRLSFEAVDIEQAAGYQRTLLVSASRVVKIGGQLVYSTCSISDQENDDNVNWALDHLPLQLVPQAISLGHSSGFSGLTQTFPAVDYSGFFIASFIKTDAPERLS